MLELWSGGGDPDEESARSAPGTGRGGAHAASRVLVVDDDPSILETVTAILVTEGYHVRAAGGGREALALAQTWLPTLVLLDMRMPHMDGWAVARALREHGATMPIVVMTAAESARRWADEIGAAGYLAKPFGLDELIACVERYGRTQRRN